MNIWKNRKSRVFLITAGTLVALFTAVNIVANGPLYSLACLGLGSKRAQFADGMEVLYPNETNGKEEAKQQGADLTKNVAEEGIVMVKNDKGLPLAQKAKISVFGKNSINLVYGGSGSGGGDTSESKTLYESLESAGFSCNPTLKAFYEDDSKSGSPREGNPKIENNGNSSIVATETPYSSYTANNIPNSYTEYSDAAVIVISRIGGEGFDLPRKSQDDPNRHYLELAPNEKDMITNVCKAGFKKVILVVNSANAMELGFAKDNELGTIDSVLLMPGPGSTGVMALGEILCGTKTPSGRTADTFVKDLRNDPTWNNFGDNNVDNGDKYTDIDSYFVDYEEGIYSGYRYYETRGETDGESWYNNAVVYPFGYGLSYADFTWEIDDSEIRNVTIQKDKTYNLKVKVTNDSSNTYSGKDVVEVYASAPYTDGGIEKASKVLVGLVKTDLLKPGEHATYDIEINPYDFASYDYLDKNGNGKATYELDGGDYKLYVGKNAHDSSNPIPFNVSKDGIVYDNDPTTGKEVKNRFEDADDHLSTVLSRSNWEATWPTVPTDADRSISTELMDQIKDTATNNPNTYTEMPTTGAVYDQTITLRDMHGVDYSDEKWDKFLDQMTPDEMIKIYNEAAFQTYDISRLKVPYTKESDVPVGFCNFMSDKNIYGTNAYTCETMLAQTWNLDLAKKMGECIGEEGFWGDSEGRVSGVPYSGIYAPGSNIHRSAFGGRNFEYFSEDPYLAGMMAASEIEGGQSRGIFMTMKHFALNEQETHRSTGYGSCSWVTEQAMREIFIKPFEIAVKKAHNHALMSSFNRIGTKWTGGDYRLLTSVLREEWGFEGLVICDFNTNSYMNTKQECYAGGDLNLAENRAWNSFDSTKASDVCIIRNAMHNVMFVLSNTNAVNGEIVGYKMPYWQIGLIIADIVLAVALIAWGVIVFIKIRKD